MSYLRIIITVLLVAAANVCCHSFDSRLRSKGYDLTEPIGISSGDTIKADNRADKVAMQTFEFGVAPAKSGRHDWQLNLISEVDTLNLSLTKTDTHFGDIDHSEGIRLIALRNGEMIFDQTVSEGVSTDRRANFLRADVFADGIDISVGHSTLHLAARLPFAAFYRRAEVTSAHDATVVRQVIAYKPAPMIEPSEFSSVDEIKAAIARSNHPIAGFWKKFDETFDTTSAFIGGDYTLAVVPIGETGDGTTQTMQIVYISGAATNAKAWRPFMNKGTLKPTPFYSNFDLEWIDALGNLITDGANAYIDGNLLILDFPLLNSRLRLARLP